MYGKMELSRVLHNVTSFGAAVTVQMELSRVLHNVTYLGAAITVKTELSRFLLNVPCPTQYHVLRGRCHAFTAPLLTIDEIRRPRESPVDHPHLRTK